MFVIIDGLDGSGKSTILEAWAGALAAEGKKVFHLKEYWNERHCHPKPEELKNFDVIISAEPTSVWTGAAIREEMIAHGSAYSTHAIATAFSLDRLVLYTRLLIPLRKQGKMIIQDRGVSSSLAYQSVQTPPLSFADNAALEGNALALAHAPDHLVIADVAVETALDRLGGRVHKNDNSFYEQKSFLEKVRQQFLNSEYQNYFTSRGAKVHILNSGQTLDIMKKEAFELFQMIIN